MVYARGMHAHRLIVLALLGIAACSSGKKNNNDKPCATDSDCTGSELCVTGAVQEISLEPGDKPVCRPADKVIGNAPPTWAWQGGGRPLAARLCMAMALDNGSDAAAQARQARELSLLEAAGVRTLRLDMTWSVIEPHKGTFDFSAYDQKIQAAHDAGFDIIGILAYGVPWATTATSTDDRFPPDNPQDYADYAAEVAKHFAGKIHRYELWNEPNGGYRFFRPNLNGDAARYAKLMVAGAKAVHGACADCTVYSAGLFFHQQIVNGAVEFTHDMLTADAHAFDGIDGFGLHPYPLYPPAAAPEDNDDGERALGGMVDDIRAVFGLHEVTLPPTAVTETGWPSYGQVDEPTQARFLARELLLAASLGLDPLCWFTLTDGPNHGTFPPEDDFGIYHFGSDDPAQSPSPKPARDALAYLSKIGTGATPAGPSQDSTLNDPASGRFALDFDAPGGRWSALWNVAGTTTVHLPGETRHAFDVTGSRDRRAERRWSRREGRRIPGLPRPPVVACRLRSALVVAGHDRAVDAGDGGFRVCGVASGAGAGGARRAREGIRSGRFEPQAARGTARGSFPARVRRHHRDAHGLPRAFRLRPDVPRREQLQDVGLRSRQDPQAGH